MKPNTELQKLIISIIVFYLRLVLHHLQTRPNIHATLNRDLVETRTIIFVYRIINPKNTKSWDCN